MKMRNAKFRSISIAIAGTCVLLGALGGCSGGSGNGPSDVPVVSVPPPTGAFTFASVSSDPNMVAYVNGQSSIEFFGTREVGQSGDASTEISFVSSKDVNGKVISLTLDKSGRVTHLKDSEGNLSSFEFGADSISAVTEGVSRDSSLSTTFAYVLGQVASAARDVSALSNERQRRLDSVSPGTQPKTRQATVRLTQCGQPATGDVRLLLKDATTGIIARSITASPTEALGVYTATIPARAAVPDFDITLSDNAKELSDNLEAICRSDSETLKQIAATCEAYKKAIPNATQLSTLKAEMSSSVGRAKLLVDGVCFASQAIRANCNSMVNSSDGKSLSQRLAEASPVLLDLAPSLVVQPTVAAVPTNISGETAPLDNTSVYDFNVNLGDTCPVLQLRNAGVWAGGGPPIYWWIDGTYVGASTSDGKVSKVDLRRFGAGSHEFLITTDAIRLDQPSDTPPENLQYFPFCPGIAAENASFVGEWDDVWQANFNHVGVIGIYCMGNYVSSGSGSGPRLMPSIVF